jgi:lysophospholipase L1-like esterase
MLLYLPINYIVGMLCWLLIVGVALRVLLSRRRRFRGVASRLRWVKFGLSLWMLLAMLTGCELYFALFVDQSDAFNMTNVSKRWFERHIEAQRNSFGARDVAEFHRSRPEGRRRICFVGDSFTIGHGLPNCEDRFSDRIGAALERSQPEKFQVANLADPGLEISQIEARVHGVLNAGYEIDVVIYVICLNDIEGYDSRTEAAIKNLQVAQPRFFLFSKTYFFNWLYFRYVQLAEPGTRDYFPHLANSYQSDAWDGFEKKFQQLHARCRDHDVELRVVIFPFLTELGNEYPFSKAHRKLMSFCKTAGLPALDLLPVFRRHANEDLTVNRFDSHPNETAHQIAADAIRDGLLSDLFQGDTSGK